MHGNLALDDRTERKDRVKTRESKKTVVRRYTIPAKEKLLYLFTIILCVIVAGLIIFRYTQIYEVNTKIQHIEKEITRLEAENRSLMLSVRKLQEPSRLNEIGVQLGFSPPADEEISQVASPPVLPREENDVALID